MVRYLLIIYKINRVIAETADKHCDHFPNALQLDQFGIFGFCYCRHSKCRCFFYPIFSDYCFEFNISILAAAPSPPKLFWCKCVFNRYDYLSYQFSVDLCKIML